MVLYRLFILLLFFLSTDRSRENLKNLRITSNVHTHFKGSNTAGTVRVYHKPATKQRYNYFVYYSKKLVSFRNTQKIFKVLSIALSSETEGSSFPPPRATTFFVMFLDNFYVCMK